MQNELRDLILSGRLPDGFRLPPERQLATALGVNRTTILSAYRELKADGLVEAHVGRGTEVVSQKAGRSAIEPTGPLPWRQLAREGSVREPDPLVRDVLALTERHDVISFAAGLPAAELLPLAVNWLSVPPSLDVAHPSQFRPLEETTDSREAGLMDAFLAADNVGSSVGTSSAATVAGSR